MYLKTCGRCGSNYDIQEQNCPNCQTENVDKAGFEKALEEKFVQYTMLKKRESALLPKELSVVERKEIEIEISKDRENTQGGIALTKYGKFFGMGKTVSNVITVVKEDNCATQLSQPTVEVGYVKQCKLALKVSNIVLLIVLFVFSIFTLFSNVGQVYAETASGLKLVKFSPFELIYSNKTLSYFKTQPNYVNVFRDITRAFSCIVLDFIIVAIFIALLSLSKTQNKNRVLNASLILIVISIVLYYIMIVATVGFFGVKCDCQLFVKKANISFGILFGIFIAWVIFWAVLKILIECSNKEETDFRRIAKFSNGKDIAINSISYFIIFFMSVLYLSVLTSDFSRSTFLWLFENNFGRQGVGMMEEFSSSVWGLLSVGEVAVNIYSWVEVFLVVASFVSVIFAIIYIMSELLCADKNSFKKIKLISITLSILVVSLYLLLGFIATCINVNKGLANNTLAYKIYLMSFVNYLVPAVVNGLAMLTLYILKVIKKNRANIV